MKYDTKSFQERFNRWKNGENYWNIRYYVEGKDQYDDYVEKIAPALYNRLQEVNKLGWLDNAVRQTAIESLNGTSNAAKTLHNYGGIVSPKTGQYKEFKDEQDFANYYISGNLLMDKKYNNVLDETDPRKAARILKDAGYYEASYEEYSNKMANMKKIDAAMGKWKLNPKNAKTKGVPNMKEVLKGMRDELYGKTKKGVPTTLKRPYNYTEW